MLMCGRPDPLSKIRPVLYVPTGPVKDIRAPSFASNEYEDALIRMKERELEWLVYRQRVDIENHRFWVSPFHLPGLLAHAV